MEKREPSAPKAVRVPAPDEAKVDEEIKQLFSGRMAESNEPVPDKMEGFISSTAHSKIAVIVPMFGYWMDVRDGFLNKETLTPSLNRVNSFSHDWYTFLASEPERMSPEVYKVLNGPYVGGNLRGIRMPQGSTYAQYVQKSIEVALEETRAQYIVVVNPWCILQKGALDRMVERVNLNGHSPVVCGFDVHREMKWDAFESFKTRQPREYASYKAKHMLSFDFIGMKRMVAELCHVDTRFKTQQYAERDFFQQLAMKGFDAIVTDRVPIFGLDVPWSQYVPQEWYEQDLDAFKRKWSFAPADIRIPDDRKHD